MEERKLALDALVTGIAHEINTPVGIALTSASYLQEETGRLKKRIEDEQLTKADVDRFLGVCTTSVDLILSNLFRTADHINHFKQIAADQRGDNARHFNLKSFLWQLIQSWSVPDGYGDVQTRLECDENLAIFSDPSALSQILGHLHANALAHGYDSGDTGEIVIEARQADWRLMISFRDDGKGMEEDHRTRIFDPFFTTRRGAGDIGLGMHIVYNIVSKLKGTIVCESKPNEGTSFLIDVPCNEAG